MRLLLGFVIVGLLLGELALVFVIDHCFALEKKYFPESFELWWIGIGSLIFFGSLLAAILIFISIKERISAWQALFLEPFYRQKTARLFIPCLLSALGGTVILGEITNWIEFFFPPSHELIRIFNVYFGLENPFASFFLYALVAPLTEELLFRGVLLRIFRLRYGDRFAILITAALFGLIHLNPYQASSGFLAGIYLGWITVRTNNILPALVSHSLFNSLPLVVTLLGQRIPGYNTRIDQGFQPSLWLLGGLICLVVGIYLTFLCLDKNFTQKEQLKQNRRFFN